MSELNIGDLYKLFEDNNLSPKGPVAQQPPQNFNSMIKVGDIVVTEFKGREFRGEISRIYEKSGNDTYDIKVGETIISVKFDNILEHYPKNIKFENPVKKEIPKQEKKTEIKKTVKPPVTETKKVVPTKIEKTEMTEIVKEEVQVETKIEEAKVEPAKPSNKVDKEEQPKKVLQDPKKLEKEEIETNPDNAPPTNEKLDSKKEVKIIGKVVHFSGLKMQEVLEFLTSKNIDNDRCWYMVSEKGNGELHVIRHNDKGFKIQPFVLSFMEIQVKDKKLNENSTQIKIEGNNNFSIIKNIPNALYDLIRNGLIVLLSK